MIELINIEKRYGQHKVFSGLNLKLENPGITAFLGANGAGKTTLMDIISGCKGFDRGEVFISQINLSEDPVACKQQVGYVPETEMFRYDQTSIEAIRFIARLYGLSAPDINRRCVEMLHLFDLESVAYSLTGTLSKGMRQRLALACALVHNPKIIILDEPTDGLDPIQRIKFIEYIKVLSARSLVFLSSHALAEVESFCDHLVLIKEGQLLAHGSLRSLLCRSNDRLLYRVSPIKSLQRLLSALNEALRSSKFSGQVDFCESASDNQSIDFGVPASLCDEVLEFVCRVVLQGDFGLRQLTRIEKGLEELYFEISQSRVRDHE